MLVGDMGPKVADRGDPIPEPGRVKGPIPTEAGKPGEEAEGPRHPKTESLVLSVAP